MERLTLPPLREHPDPAPRSRRAAGRLAGGGEAPRIVDDVLSGPSRPLDSSARGRLEPRFGHDFSTVRIHTGPRAAESARAVNALAYTAGRHIVFGTGRYTPDSRPGLSLLAHELAHTIQQGDRTPGTPLTLGAAGDACETAAARASDAALSGGRAHAGPRTGFGVQRQPAGSLQIPDTPLSDRLLDNASPMMASTMGSAQLDGFVTGSSDLLPRHRVEIKTRAHDILVLLRQYPLSTVHVTGHTDTVGAEAYNKGLGQARADAVRAEFIAQGVPEVCLDAQSAGEGPPQAVPTKDNVPNASNRRVVVYFEVRKFGRSARLGSGSDQPNPEPTPKPKPDAHDGSGTLPPPPESEIDEALGGLVQTKHAEDDPKPHPALDLSSGVTANAPTGTNPTTYSVSLVWRNVNLHTFGGEHTPMAVDLLHEPNFSLQLSPDPQNPQVYQAAVTIVNWHLRRHGEDLVEIGLSAMGQLNSAGTPGAGAQLQAELHLTSHFSLTASTSLGVGPHSTGPSMDRGSIPLGTAGGDWNWSPFGVGVLVHY